MNKKLLYIAIAAAAILLLVLIGLLFWEPVIDALPIDQSGWKDMDGIHIYQNEDGDPLTGWQDIEGKRYYFAPDNGAMRTGWQDIGGKRYHFGEDGVLSIGWLSVNDVRFYLLPDGSMAAGWQEIDGEAYYFAETGNPLTGWQDIEDVRYYFNADGIRQSGWVDVDGTSYYLDTDGSLFSGWMPDGSCYILADGTMATGLQTIDSTYYYFNDDGTAYSGWLETGNGRYHFDETGAALTGWQELDGTTYYFQEDGVAAVGKLVLDEKTYYFTSTGANIIMVNPWNYLPEDYEVELVELESGHKVAAQCYDALMQMLADCEAAGFDPYLYSSYRTQSHQQRLFDNMLKQEGSYAAASKIVAVPGTSEHQLGLAVDITDNGFRKLNKQQEQTDTQQWLMANCWDYGFIVRYPNGTTDITGIIYEPWHYRYVGIELAMELKDSGVTLEEYLDALTNDGTTCGNPAAKTTE